MKNKKNIPPSERIIGEQQDNPSSLILGYLNFPNVVKLNTPRFRKINDFQVQET